jgi:inosose dehydratase
MLQSLAVAAVLGAAPKSPVIGLAAGTYGMKTLSPQEALRTIAEIGYDGVEPCLITGWPSDSAKLSAPDRLNLRAVLGETGLAVPALLESLSITGVAAKRASNLERLKLAVDLGNELIPSTPPVIDTVIGGKTADWEKLKGTMADELHAWARVAEDSKTTICFKPHAAQAVNSPERAIWLLKEVGSPRIRIVYDYSHFYLEGFPLASSLKQLLPYTAFISVKDAAGTPAKAEYLLPGDGKTDYLEYFRLLKELRYSGFVGVEVSAMIQHRPEYKPVPTTRLCYERLAPLFARAGVERPARKPSG